MSMFGFSNPYQGFPSAFDADEMRRQSLWRGVQQAGLNLLNPDPSLPPSLARSLGRGLTGFAQGADQGRQAYEQQGLTRMKMQEYQSAQDTERRKQEALTELLKDSNLDPSLRNWIMANPDHAWDVIKGQFEGPKEPPTSVQEYQYGQKDPGFRAYQESLKKAGGTTVNVGPAGEDFGQPGPGLVWARDPKTRQILLDEQGLPIAMPFKGGKAYEEKLAAEQAEKNKQNEADKTAGVVTEEIGRAKKLILSNPTLTTGLLGSYLKEWGGSDARDVQGLIKTITANVGIDKLQAMRNASPTGASGLGQLTEKEMAFLQATLGDLEQSQSAEQLIFNLTRLNGIIERARSGESLLPDERDGGGLADPLGIR